jgi:hypothetical protein
VAGFLFFFFQDTHQTGELLSIFTRQVRKQLAKYIERVNERGKNPRQLVCFFFKFENFYSTLSPCELYMHTHTIGYATWVTLESRLHNSGADQSFPVSFNRASFSNRLFFIHIFYPAFFHLSI